MSKAQSGPFLKVLGAQRDEILAIVKRHNGTSVAVFGSVARGEDGADSDVDLLVEFAPGASLFDQARIQQDTEALIGRSVDVVSVAALLPEDSDILADAIPL